MPCGTIMSVKSSKIFCFLLSYLAFDFFPSSKPFNFISPAFTEEKKTKKTNKKINKNNKKEKMKTEQKHINHIMTSGTTSLIIPKLKNMEKGLVSPH